MMMQYDSGNESKTEIQLTGYGVQNPTVECWDAELDERGLRTRTGDGTAVL